MGSLWKAKTYLKITVLNLLILAAGIWIGINFFPSATRTVYAQEPEDITPSITAGSAAFGTLLAGRLAADEIAIKGIDVGKLQENLLNLLASKPLLMTRAEVQSVVERSRVRPLRMKSPEPPKPQPPVESKKDGKQ